VKRVALLIGLVCVLGSSGCATIMAGGPDHVQVATNPPGAQVFVDEQFVGTTPGIITLDRQHAMGRIRIQAPGYQPIVIIRGKGINGWFWANLCIGGVLGIVIDLVTGDYQRFDDEPILVNLVPMAGPMPPCGGNYGPCPMGPQGPMGPQTPVGPPPAGYAPAPGAQ
jgi:PEGA domain